MIRQIYPTEFPLNKAIFLTLEAPFLDLGSFVTGGLVTSKIYDKQDDFDFESKSIFSGWRCSPLPFLQCIYSTAFLFCKSKF